MKIYTDTDFEFLFIDDIGLFEWKQNNVSKIDNLITKSNKLPSDALNYYCFAPKDEIQFNANINNIQNTEPNDLVYGFDAIPNKLSISKLFKMINTLKSIKGSAMSKLMAGININEENELLVISSTNKNLITLFINKIATMGIFPINQMLTTESNNTVLYKYYYEPDNNDEFDDDDDYDDYF